VPLICALIWADKPPSKTSMFLFCNPCSIVKSLGPLFHSISDPDNALVSSLSLILLKTTSDVVVQTITNFVNQLIMLNLAGDIEWKSLAREIKLLSTKGDECRCSGCLLRSLYSEFNMVGVLFLWVLRVFVGVSSVPSININFLFCYEYEKVLLWGKWCGPVIKCVPLIATGVCDVTACGRRT
jgi:hypothetical protein